MASSRAKRGSSPSAAGPYKRRSHKKIPGQPYSKTWRLTNEDVLPGVQKLKSALRQTKRLLARNNLAADVRVETERRLKALQSDLSRAEQSRKERQYAIRYHKVKFFERQKIVRKINQTKRSIATLEGKEKEALASTLTNLRVDLNYVLHFPKTMKYISLFPQAVRGSGSTPVAASLEDNKERPKIREMIRQRMERGELDPEPEKNYGKLQQESKQFVSVRRHDAGPSTKVRIHTEDVAGDDFFGDEEEEDTERSEASDS